MRCVRVYEVCECMRAWCTLLHLFVSVCAHGALYCTSLYTPLRPHGSSHVKTQSQRASPSARVPHPPDPSLVEVCGGER
jgi:hypothetical protein